MIFSLYHDTIIVDIYITDIFMPTLYCNIPMGRQMQRGGDETISPAVAQKLRDASCHCH